MMTSLESSYPTSTTSSLNRMNHMLRSPKGVRNSRVGDSAIARNSSGPITDIKGNTTTKSSTSNIKSPTNTKITTPNATMPQKLESELQRSASMRRRESARTECTGNGKSLLSACDIKESNEGSIGVMANKTEQHQQQQQQTFNEVTHEFSSTGNGSRQKKVARNLLLRSALEQRTRNLTLSGKFKFDCKTDANDQNGVDVGAKTDLNYIETKECNGVNGNSCNSIAESDTLNKEGVDMNGETNEGGEVEHIQPVESLNHESSKALTTGTINAPLTQQQHIRPSTLATENGFPIAALPTSPSAIKSTPKTPNSTPLHNETTNNRNCKQQYTSPEVPRTTTTVTTTTSTTAVPLKLTPKTPPVTPDSPATYLDDDLDSIYSFATTTSGRSTMSCEHSYVAHNGTTFSGRKNKFVIHNSQYAGLVGSAYVTPTQRAQNQIRKLKALLHAMQQDLNQKNDEILRLTREVAELRLFKASLNSPEERSASSDAVTVREAELQTSQDVSPIVDMVDDAMKSSPRHLASSSCGSGSGSGHSHSHSGYHNYLQQQQSVMQLSSEMQSSFADSGHFEDMTSMSVHSKDSYAANTQDDDEDDGVGGATRGNDAANAVAAAEREVEVQRQELIRMYEQRIEELIRNQDAASNEMKRLHNDKIEALLQKLSECNTRYADIVPDYEMAKERIRELEGQLENLQRKLFDQEDKQNKMYLHMYQKGQEAERIARADQALELAHRAPTNRVSINELLHQLQSTQDELENIRAAECRNEGGSNHALLTAKEAISLWVLGARKTIYRRLLEAQKNRTHVDPEVTLQFLKSAVYYFLTDKENSQGHLQAIESILEFTEAEKQNINKARTAK